MKVLITGTEGFIGKNLCEHINKKRIIDFIKFKGDLKEAETYPKDQFDIVIHLAAKITHRGDFGDEEIYETNVLGTKKLLDFYPDAKFIYISTTDVTCPTLSLYAQTKLEAEELIKKRKDSLIIRLPSVFGPNQRQDKLIPRLFRHYCLGGECKISNNDLREYIFIDEVSEKIIENLSNSGLITLRGIKIKNLRLQELVKDVCLDKKTPDLKADENKLFNQLKICRKSVKSKNI